MLCACSYFEIYNERVRELLPSTDTQGCELRVREHPIDGPYVEGKLHILANNSLSWCPMHHLCGVTNSNNFIRLNILYLIFVDEYINF